MVINGGESWKLMMIMQILGNVSDKSFLYCWANGNDASMKKSYVSVLISVVKLELAAPNILKMMDIG